MLQILGKIIVLFFLLGTLLWAKVSIEVPKNFVQGDIVEFEIVASGAKVEFPNIEKIEQYPVQPLGRSIQTNIINGKRSQQVMQKFAFRPNKDVTIPPFSIKIDGKIEKTPPQKLRMGKMAKTVSELFDFSIAVDNTTPYVGEDIVLDVVFKYRKDINIVDLEFQKPTFDGFWVKQLEKSNVKLQKDPNYHYQTLQFLLFPQKTGSMELGPFKIGVTTMSGNIPNSFFLSGTGTKKLVYSNSIPLEVKQLPSNVQLVGEFAIETSVDKTEVNIGEAISYKVKITGYGNVDDIPQIKLDIPSATIYENPANKNFAYGNQKYGGEYTKVFSIVPSKGFSIVPIVFEYFDTKTLTVKKLQSKRYDIKVVGQSKEQTVLETSPNENENEKPKENTGLNQGETTTTVITTQYDKVLYFVFGAASMIIVFVVVKLFKSFSRNKKPKENVSVPPNINKSQSKKELLQILAVYINLDKDLDKIIYQIETEQDPKILKQLKKDAIKLMKQKNIKGSL